MTPQVRLTEPRTPSAETLGLRWDDLFVDHAAKMDLSLRRLETVADVARLTLAELTFFGIPEGEYRSPPKIRRRGILSILAVLSELGVALADGTFLLMPVGTDLVGLHSLPSGTRDA